MFAITWQPQRADGKALTILGVLLVMSFGCATHGISGKSTERRSTLFRGQSPRTNSRASVPEASLGTPSSQSPRRKESRAGENYNSRRVVLSVNIEGNRTIGDDEIRRHIKTRKGRAYDPQLVQKDLRRLFGTRKFHNVRVREKEEEGGLHLTFEIVERPLIDEVQFIGNRRFSDKKLRKESGLQAGDPLDMYMVQEARRKIEEYYRSNGFAKTGVSIAEGDKRTDRRVVLKVDEGQIERIWKVNFVGNDPALATDARLKTLIESKPGVFKYLFGGKVDYSQIDEDRQRLVSYYRGLGYFKAKVSRIVEESEQWITLTFVIDEGPRYEIRDISVIGNKKFDSETLIGFLELKKGDYFNLETMEHDENALRDLYGGNGHVFADIKASPRFLETPGQLDIVYRIEEGELFRVGEINIHVAGHSPHTRRDVILNRLSLQPGDIIDIRKVRASERRLKASQLFVTNPAEGKPPQIVIRPPDLSEAASMARRQERGQSPRKANHPD
ncbi:MAG: BamA/OMP85 family outer membrane protein [Planctomycetota bacterium]